MTWAKLVQEFNEANGYPTPLDPLPEIRPELQILRLRLMMEELGELSKAMHEKDLINVADGITDLLYVVVGTAVEYGLGPKLDELFREVHASNMTKDFITGADGRKGGVKGASYRPPNISMIVHGVKRATYVVHWPGQDSPACDWHAGKLAALATSMGFTVASSPCLTNEPCKNCENEQRKRS